MAELLSRLQAALAGRYTIERELGRGGMATVYLAQDLKHDRAVAIKVLHPELASGIGVERFLREIKVAARLQAGRGSPVVDSGVRGDSESAVALQARVDHYAAAPITNTALPATRL